MCQANEDALNIWVVGEERRGLKDLDLSDYFFVTLIIYVHALDRPWAVEAIGNVYEPFKTWTVANQNFAWNFFVQVCAV